MTEDDHVTELGFHNFLAVLKGLADICESFNWTDCCDAKGSFKSRLPLESIWPTLSMGNLQNLERTVVIAVVGFFSLLISIILLSFCLFTVYNCFYKRMAQKYFRKMESETQTTDVENDASLQEFSEILIGRHELTRIMNVSDPVESHISTEIRQHKY